MKPSRAKEPKQKIAARKTRVAALREMKAKEANRKRIVKQLKADSKKVGSAMRKTEIFAGKAIKKTRKTLRKTDGLATRLFSGFKW